jgi:hypothetical protein
MTGYDGGSATVRTVDIVPIPMELQLRAGALGP